MSDGEIIPDYLGWPSVIMRVLVNEKEWREDQVREVRMEIEDGMMKAKGAGYGKPLETGNDKGQILS